MQFPYPDVLEKKARLVSQREETLSTKCCTPPSNSVVQILVTVPTRMAAAPGSRHPWKTAAEKANPFSMPHGHRGVHGMTLVRVIVRLKDSLWTFSFKNNRLWILSNLAALRRQALTHLALLELSILTTPEVLGLC